MLLAEVRAQRAVANVPLYTSLRPPPGPSLGGLTAGQMDEVARKQASAERAWEAEQAARERVVAERAETAEILAAGQTEENAAWIRRTARSGT
jgi:hypothetical protein